MLRLFRKSRLKTLLGSKFGRYLLYGMGEVLLVVIGILLALQINSWKQFRDNREIERDLLKRIYADLEGDIIDLERSLLMNQDLISDHKNLIKGIGSKNINIEDFVAWNQGFGMYSVFFINRSTYDAAISTGTIGQLLNEGLRDGILLYYTFPGTGADMSIREILNNNMMPIWNNKLAYTREYAAAAGIPDNNLKSMDLENYYNDNDYIGLLTHKLGLLNLQNVQWIEKMDDIKGLKTDIEQELEKRWGNIYN